MSKVRVHMMAALDGYVAGPNQSVDKPFGEGTEHFLDWLFRLRLRAVATPEVTHLKYRVVKQAS